MVTYHASFSCLVPEFKKSGLYMPSSHKVLVKRKGLYILGVRNAVGNYFHIADITNYQKFKIAKIILWSRN
jgi:hypothetical protein